MAIKLADTLAPMSEFPAAMAEHIGFSDGATLQEKFDNKELGGGDDSVTLTQQEYEALSEEQKLDGLYYTYDTKRIYKNGVQYGASEPIPLTMEEYKALKEAGAIDEQQEYLIEANAEGILLGAEDIGYNNAESGIQATTVQGAIDKVVKTIEDKVDVPLTTVDFAGTDIHGTVMYLVKSGICYVSAWGISADTAKTAHRLVPTNVMPKPVISAGTVLVHGDSSQNGKIVGQLYIDNIGALSLHIYSNNVGNMGYGSFSYPVAES